MSEKPDPGTPRFLAWLYSTPSQRPVLAALCGIEREIAASLRPGIDHHVAHTRLEWWRAECGRCAAGDPAHPLTRQLRAGLEELAPAAQASAALAGLTGLVDAAAWDLAGATFERRVQLSAYCRQWAAAMVTPLALAGSPVQDAAAGWSGFGPALRELELLGDVARDARCGRLRVPLDELERAAIGPQALAAPPWPLELAAILRTRHRALRQQLAAAAATLSPASQRSARGLLVWAALARQASRRAERALPHPPAASLASAAAANWRAWRTARAADAGRFGLG